MLLPSGAHQGSAWRGTMPNMCTAWPPPVDSDSGCLNINSFHSHLGGWVLLGGVSLLQPPVPSCPGQGVQPPATPHLHIIPPHVPVRRWDLLAGCTCLACTSQGPQTILARPSRQRVLELIQSGTGQAGRQRGSVHLTGVAGMLTWHRNASMGPRAEARTWDTVCSPAAACITASARSRIAASVDLPAPAHISTSASSGVAAKRLFLPQL